MAKQNYKTTSKQSQPNSPSFNNWTGRHPVKTVLSILVLGLVIWGAISITVQHVQQNREKAQFLQAKTDLATIYEQIAAQVGQPTQHKATQTCSYTSAEWSQGFLYCNLFEKFYYTLPADQTQSKGNAILSSIRSIKTLKNLEFNSGSSDPLSSTLGSALFTVGPLQKCGAQVVNVSTSSKKDYSSYSGFLLPSSDGISVELYCSKPALAEYFPVVKN